MSATGVEIKKCADGRQVFQLLYAGAPDACAPKLPDLPTKPGLGPIPADGLIANWLKANPLPDWLLSGQPQPNDPAITPAVNPPGADPTPAAPEAECSCGQGQNTGPSLIFLILTLIWLTA